MIISLLIIIFVGYFSLSYTTLGGDSVLFSVIFPIIDFFAFLSLALWIVILLHKLGIKQSSSSMPDSENGLGGDGGSD